MENYHTITSALEHSQVYKDLRERVAIKKRIAVYEFIMGVCASIALVSFLLAVYLTR